MSAYDAHHRRLILNGTTLRYVSGLRWLARWLDWELSLDALRAGQRSLNWAGMPTGLHPEWNYHLHWGSPWLISLRSLKPRCSHPPGTDAPERQPARRSLRLTRWHTPKNRALLLQRLMAYPVMRALQAQAVPLPQVTGRRQMGRGPGSLDLMALPRVRRALYASLLCLVLATGLFLWTLDEYFFQAPTLDAVLLLPTLTACGAFPWLRGDAQQARARFREHLQLALTPWVVAAALGSA